jgi:hypothetical protein
MQAPKASNHNGAVPDAILHPGSRSLFSHWNWLRGERSAPRRQEIDLRALVPVLPWIGIIERGASPGRYRWRLAGTGIARLWGDGLTGRQVAADWPDVYRRALMRALDGVCERRQPFVARLKAVSADGEALGIEFFAAPVETSDGASVQALCCVAPFREPHWLGHVPLVDVELSVLTDVGTAPLPDEIELVRSRSLPATKFRLIQGGRSD